MKTKKIFSSLCVAATVLLAGCFSESSSIPDVTPEKFTQIKEGMKYKEVADLLGSPGRQNSSQDVGGTVVRAYSWPNSKGSEILILFGGDTVIQAIPGMDLNPPLK